MNIKIGDRYLIIADNYKQNIMEIKQVVEDSAEYISTNSIIIKVFLSDTLFRPFVIGKNLNGCNMGLKYYKKLIGQEAE